MNFASLRAVVLGNTPFSESSRITALFTREQGRLSALAKGALRRGSRFGPALEPFALTRCQVSVNPRREVQTLASAELEDYFPHARSRPGSLCAAEAAVEVVRQAALPHAPQLRVFDLLTAYLKRLDREFEAPPALLERMIWAFILHLLKALGWGVGLSDCASCGTAVPAGPALISPRMGGLLCRMCGGRLGEGRKLTEEEVKLLKGLSEGPFDAAVALPGGVPARINPLLKAFLEARFEKNVTLNSLDLFYSLRGRAPHPPLTAPWQRGPRLVHA